MTQLTVGEPKRVCGFNFRRIAHSFASMHACDVKFVGINVCSTCLISENHNIYTHENYPLYNHELFPPSPLTSVCGLCMRNRCVAEKTSVQAGAC